MGVKNDYANCVDYTELTDQKNFYGNSETTLSFWKFMNTSWDLSSWKFMSRSQSAWKFMKRILRRGTIYLRYCSKASISMDRKRVR